MRGNPLIKAGCPQRTHHEKHKVEKGNNSLHNHHYCDAIKIDSEYLNVANYRDQQDLVLEYIRGLYTLQIKWLRRRTSFQN
jgi:hypothetical protein